MYFQPSRRTPYRIIIKWCSGEPSRDNESRIDKLVYHCTDRQDAENAANGLLRFRRKAGQWCALVRVFEMFSKYRVVVRGPKQSKGKASGTFDSLEDAHESCRRLAAVGEVGTVVSLRRRGYSEYSGDEYGKLMHCYVSLGGGNAVHAACRPGPAWDSVRRAVPPRVPKTRRWYLFYSGVDGESTFSRRLSTDVMLGEAHDLLWNSYVKWNLRRTNPRVLSGGKENTVVFGSNEVESVRLYFSEVRAEEMLKAYLQRSCNDPTWVVQSECTTW